MKSSQAISHMRMELQSILETLCLHHQGYVICTLYVCLITFTLCEAWQWGTGNHCNVMFQQLAVCVLDHMTASFKSFVLTCCLSSLWICLQKFLYWRFYFLKAQEQTCKPLSKLAGRTWPLERNDGYWKNFGLPVWPKIKMSKPSLEQCIVFET
jgi:hypothetical protein